MKKILVFFITILIATCLTGCGDKELIDNTEIITSVEQYVPNAKYVDVKHSKNQYDKEQEFGINTYIFSNGEFEFVIANYMQYSPTFEWPTNTIQNHYFIELMKHRLNDIKTIADNHDFSFLFEVAYALDDNDITTHLEGDDVILCEYNAEYESDTLDFTLYIDDFEDISRSKAFFDEVCAALSDYAPSGSNDICDYDFFIEVYHYDEDESVGPMLYEWKEDFVRDWLTFDNDAKWIEHHYANAVRDGDIQNDGLSTEAALEYPPMIIDKLYIDGERFISERYGTIFEYDVDQEKYYTKVIFGVDDEDVCDYLQREIIEQYYSGNKYTIDDEGEVTTYTINRDDYKAMRCQPWSSNSSYISISKNGEEIPLDTYKTYASKHATEYYLAIEDFAFIMNMEVDQIDTINGTIHLKIVE